MQIIAEYAQFWKLLSEHHTQLSQLKRVCDNILQYKQSIKDLFSDLEQIIRLNIELYQLSFYYHNHVIFEPMEAKLFDKKVTLLKQQISLEFGRDNFLYALDKNAFVVSASFQTENLGNVIWASRNAKEILEIDEKLLRSLHINTIMPKVISSIHDEFLIQYLNIAKSRIVNGYMELWALTYKKKLLSMKMCVKLYFEPAGLHLISFIRKTSDKNSLIINEYGEIDSFGENFNKMSNTDYDFGFTYSHISIFSFMPQMIIHFLNFFYGLEKFKIQDFPYTLLDDTFLMVFKDMGTKILDLSKVLKLHKDSKEAYAKALYNYLTELSFDNLEKVYRVRLKNNFFSYIKTEVSVKFWDLKIVDYIDVTDLFTAEHFNQQKCFLEKIKFDESLKVSIEKYNNRLMEHELEEQAESKREDTMNISQVHSPRVRDDPKIRNSRRSTNFNIQMDFIDESENESFFNKKHTLYQEEHEDSGANRRSQRKITNGRRSTVKFIQKATEKTGNVEKNNELEVYKATAINIIRKLFTKNFNPLKEKEIPSGSRKRWIDSVNNYIQKRNSIISTIVDYHIGEFIRKHP